jgi:hypothetical protein
VSYIIIRVIIRGRLELRGEIRCYTAVFDKEGTMALKCIWSLEARRSRRRCSP